MLRIKADEKTIWAYLQDFQNWHMDLFETYFTKQNSIKTLGLSAKHKFDMHENAYMPVVTKKQDFITFP